MIRLMMMALVLLTPYPTQTPYPTYTPFPTATWTPYPTYTPYPTFTPYPSPTWTPSPTPTATSAQSPTPTETPITRYPQGLIMTMTPTTDYRATPDAAAATDRDGPGLLLIPIVLLGLVVLAVPALYLLRRSDRFRLMLAKYAARRDPAEREHRRQMKAHERREREKRRTLKKIAQALAQRTALVLSGVGFVHEYRNPGQKKKKYQRIQFSHAVVVGEEQVLLRVSQIPYRKSRWELFSNAPGTGSKPVQHGASVVSWYATELYLALERQVQITFYEDVGILIQIALREGVGGVPRLVLWRDPEQRQFSMMEGDPFDEGAGRIRDHQRYPDTRYLINIGLGRNRELVRQDLRILPHLIVSGTTGSGKSNFLNQMICTWLERNTPETLNLYLLDLKIMEFAPYLRLSREDSDVVGPSMVVNVVQDEIEAAHELEALYDEIVRRQNKMAGICIDLDGWNDYARDDPAESTMPRIVVVFDELSIIMLNKKKVGKRAISSIALEFLAKCVAVGRSVGVHMVLCTQVVSKQVLDLLVQGNTPGKMIFRQANRTASINALGDGRAWSHLQQSGMGYFCDEQGNETILQTPLIYEHQRDAAIEGELARIQGRAEEDKPLSIEDVLRYAVINYRGKMAYRDLWVKFKGRITAQDLKAMLTAYYDKVVNWNLRNYLIVPGSGKRATRAECLTMVHVPSVPCSESDISDDEIPIGTPIPSPDSDNGHHHQTPEPDDGDEYEDFDYDEYLEMTRRAQPWADD